MVEITMYGGDDGDKGGFGLGREFISNGVVVEDVFGKRVPTSDC